MAFVDNPNIILGIISGLAIWGVGYVFQTSLNQPGVNISQISLVSVGCITLIYRYAVVFLSSNGKSLADAQPIINDILSAPGGSILPAFPGLTNATTSATTTTIATTTTPATPKP